MKKLTIYDRIEQAFQECPPAELDALLERAKLCARLRGGPVLPLPVKRGRPAGVKNKPNSEVQPALPLQQ